MEKFESLCLRFINLGPLVSRLGLSVVFIYFSFHKLSSPGSGTAEIEQLYPFLSHGAASLTNYYTGIFEGVVALSFIFGWRVRLFGFLAGGMIGTIMLSFLANGLLNDAVYRDAGLAGAALSLMFTGAGSYSLDAKLKERKSGKRPRLAIMFGDDAGVTEDVPKKEEKTDSSTPFQMPPSKLNM